MPQTHCAQVTNLKVLGFFFTKHGSFLFVSVMSILLTCIYNRIEERVSNWQWLLSNEEPVVLGWGLMFNNLNLVLSKFAYPVL